MTDSPKFESSACDRENDLHWLAFCYVANELTQEQTIAFEQRLADDLEAQEALAEVMSMSVSVYDAFAENDLKRAEDSKVAKVDLANAGVSGAGSEKGSVNANNWYAVVAVAACLLVAVSVWQSLGTGGTGGDSSQSDLVAGVIDEAELSERWLEILESGSDWEDAPRHVVNRRKLVDVAVESGLGESGLGESVPSLLVDPDMVAIFSSAISDIAKGGM